jgi:hypothetical protein
MVALAVLVVVEAGVLLLVMALLLHLVQWMAQ